MHSWRICNPFASLNPLVRTEERGENLDGNGYETCACKHLLVPHQEAGSPWKQNILPCCSKGTDSQTLFILETLLVKVEVSKFFRNKCPIFRLWIRGNAKSEVRTCERKWMLSESLFPQPWSCRKRAEALQESPQWLHILPKMLSNSMCCL